VVSGGVQTNDWIIAILTAGGALSLTKKPTMTGWTELVAFAQVGAGTMCFGVYARKRLAGDSAYSITQTTAETNNTFVRMIFVRGADDVANWIKGVFTARAVNATTTTTVAVSATTAIAN